MSGEYEGPADAAFKTLASMANQTRAALEEATRTPLFEYQIVAWEQVNPLARAGWELRAADIALYRFLMCRKLGPSDEAAALLGMP